MNVSSTQPRPAAAVADTRCLINGVWTDADTGDRFPVTDPATGALLAEVPLMGAAETRRAIESAHAAFTTWAARTAAERAAVLRRWAALMTEQTERLAVLLSTEQGKPLTEARGEISYAVSFLEFFAAQAQQVHGETIPAHRADTRILVLKQPVGVVGAITPWNFPAAMITRKSAPAIAAGCTVVLKPAEQTPLSALAIAALAEQAELPAGVLNIVTGNAAEIGTELCDNPLVRMLTFTGSTEVGRIIAARCASTVKKMALELGGNAPFIVFDDADLDAAVDGAVVSKFRHTGQSCVGTNRFYIHQRIYDDFIERFTRRVRRLTVGPATDPRAEIGPLIEPAALAKVESHVADAIAAGARLLTGGHRHPLGGTFYQPTVLADVTAQMRIAQEETFGPVAALLPFSDEADAVASANDTPFGLAGYLYTTNLARAWRVAEALQVGMVGVNSGFLSVPMAPFGGVKQSGIGREGSHHGIEEFLELKYMCLGAIR